MTATFRNANAIAAPTMLARARVTLCGRSTAPPSEPRLPGLARMPRVASPTLPERASGVSRAKPKRGQARPLVAASPKTKVQA